MPFSSAPRAVPTVQRDDELVTITRWNFSPGAATGWHEHGWPYCIVMMNDGVLRIDNGTGETETKLSAGDAYIRPAGVKHDVMNASAHPIAFVEIEIKGLAEGAWQAL